MPSDPSAFPAVATARQEPGPVDPVSPDSSGGLVWRRIFPGRLDQVREARRFVRFLLADDPRADDAELIVSELAGNALRHTRSGLATGRFTVEVVLDDSAAGILLTVYDHGGTGTPRFTGHDQQCCTEEHGRGLAMVSAIATRAGYQGTPSSGHRVWAYLSPCLP
ncbi:ATP-binding protein [Sphaerisporangium sp. NPDC051011]|uniref:ATP-binding protein n=1 Tax=Sphaerisporangium sp. NPDC051011 TaxID=3155792 RepID=UPI0033F0E034